MVMGGNPSFLLRFLTNQPERPRGLIGIIGNIFWISQGARYARDVSDRGYLSFGGNSWQASFTSFTSFTIVRIVFPRGLVRDYEAAPRFHSGQLAAFIKPTPIIISCIHPEGMPTLHL